MDWGGARARAAERAAERAARLPEARAVQAGLLRPLQAAAFNTVPNHAADVFACANDPGIPAAELGQAIAKLYAAAEELAELARTYRDAADEAAQGSWIRGV